MPTALGNEKKTDATQGFIRNSNCHEYKIKLSFSADNICKHD